MNYGYLFLSHLASQSEQTFIVNKMTPESLIHSLNLQCLSLCLHLHCVILQHNWLRVRFQRLALHFIAIKHTYTPTTAYIFTLAGSYVSVFIDASLCTHISLFSSNCIYICRQKLFLAYVFYTRIPL